VRGGATGQLEIGYFWGARFHFHQKIILWDVRAIGRIGVRAYAGGQLNGRVYIQGTYCGRGDIKKLREDTVRIGIRLWAGVHGGVEGGVDVDMRIHGWWVDKRFKAKLWLGGRVAGRGHFDASCDWEYCKLRVKADMRVQGYVKFSVWKISGQVGWEGSASTPWHEFGSISTPEPLRAMVRYVGTNLLPK